MSGQPDRADVPAIRRAHPIEEVVRAAGVELRRAGHGFVGCCPFHDDSTPSMSVGGVPDRFTCFGCGAHGDVIDFVRQLHGITFPEAVRHLTGGTVVAATASPGLPAPRPDRPAATISAARGFEVNQYAWQHFTRPVAAGFAASYLSRRRGLDLRALRDDNAGPLVGHAGHGWTSLTDELTSRGVTAGELLAMDLSQWTRQGRLVDTMRHRIIIPVAYPDHRILGFIGRDVSGVGDAPKYRNPTKTPTFDKSAVLYRPTHHTISASGTIVVVEGVIDALAVAAAAAAAGRTGEFAPCTASGVAVTTTQAMQVLGLAREGSCVIALDGDPAGAAGARRWLRHLAIHHLRVALVTRLPNDLDPADWIRQRGPAGLAAFDGTAKGGLVGSTRPRLPGRELAQIAHDGARFPIADAAHNVVRFAAQLPPPQARELIADAEREMTRLGWNSDDAFTRAVRRYPDVAHVYRTLPTSVTPGAHGPQIGFGHRPCLR